MGQTFKLLMLQINAKYGKAKSAHAGKYLWLAGRYLLIMAAAAIGFYAVLTWLMRLGMQSNVFLLSIALLATQSAATLFAVSSILSNLYFNKDNNLLLVLPVSANQVFISKLLMVYFSEFLINTMISFPVLVVIGIFARLGTEFYVLLPLSMLFLPLIPMGIGALMSVPISFLISFLKKHTAFTTVFILALVSGLLYVYISVMAGINGSFNVSADQIKFIIKLNARIYRFGATNYPYISVASALTAYKYFWVLLIYIAAGLGFAAVTVAIVKPVYFRSIMKNSETTDKKVTAKVKKSRYKSKRVFWSLVDKEFKDIFRSPSYVFQYFIFTLLMPVIVFCYDKLLLQLVVNDVGKGMIAGSHVLILAVIAMLSNLMSASSVSREGSNFYLMKTVPVSFYVQSFAKVCFNAMFTAGAVILTAVVSSFYLNAIEVWLASAAVIIASLAHICLSYDFDLSNPTLDWYDDSDITRMSRNTAKSLIIGMLIAIIMGVIVISSALKPLQGMLIALIVAVVLLGYALYVLLLRIYYRYAQTEV